MSTKAIIQYASRRLTDIMTKQIGQPIPNWFDIQGLKGFGFKLTEGELNFMITATATEVEEEGPGAFLVKIQATFIGQPVLRDGFEFIATPIGASLEMDMAMYAAMEQELQDGICQVIADEAENILCQILQ